MKIKSLLLGSAAALATVTGARAADAVVVAEPEPAEYVKVCDVYGAGYFYIPGTETCLRIGGYVRYDIGAGDVGSFDGARTADVRSGDDQATWRKKARFTLMTWTGQETELGTLKTYTETEMNYGNSSAYSGPDSSQNYAFFKGVSLEKAWIQLGGLRVGKSKTAFDTFIGYAGNVIQDTIVPYGASSTNLIQYNFDVGNGFSGVVSLEEGSGPVGTIDSYVPHIVGGLKYAQGWGALTGVIAYDSNYEEVAGKVRLDVNASDAVSLWLMVGYGTNGNLNDPANVIDAFGRGFYKQWGGNWAVWGGGTYKFNEKTSFNLQVSADDNKNYGVAANVAYKIKAGFAIVAEVDWDHYGRFGEAASYTNVNWTNANKQDSIGGVLRFQRDF